MRLRALQFTDHGDLLASADHLFFRVTLDGAIFPLPAPPSSDYALYTALTIGHFAVVDAFLSGRTVTPATYAEELSAEEFSFPASPSLRVPDVVRELCADPPPRWSTLDNSARNFVFCYFLTRRIPDLWGFLPFFALWALNSRDQRALCTSLSFQSGKDLLDSLLPIWAADRAVLIGAVSELIVRVVPDANEVDLFVLLSVLVDRRHAARLIARHAGQDKLASFFANLSDDPRLRTRMEKSAFEAQKQRRPSLAAMFFALRGLPAQAVLVLKDYALLQLLAARLLDVAAWHEVAHLRFGSADSPFFALWWGGRRDAAVESLRTLPAPMCGVLAVDVHRFELVREFAVAAPLDILGLQLAPYFLRVSARPITRAASVAAPARPAVAATIRRAAVSTYDFAFGAPAWDDDFASQSSDDEDDDCGLPEEHAGPPFASTIGACFARPPFRSAEPRLLSTKEGYVVRLLARLYNEQYDIRDIRNLVAVVGRLLAADRPCPALTGVVYSLALVYSVTPVMIALFANPDDVVALKLLWTKFQSPGLAVPSARPDVLSPYTTAAAPITESDRLLANFISFHELCSTVSDQLGHHGMSPIPAFFHHRHRLWFAQLPAYAFTHAAFERDMGACGFAVADLSSRMAEVSQARKWHLTHANAFVSPFYAEHRFKFTHTFELRARPGGGPLAGVCINPFDNDEIAVAGGPVQVFHLRDHLPIEPAPIVSESRPSSSGRLIRRSSSANLRRSDFKSFDSPFIDFLPRDPAHAPAPGPLAAKRKFFPRWGATRLSHREIRTTCVAAHPTRPYFVTGSDTGSLHHWAFGQKALVPDSSVQYVSCPVREVVFNQTGDRLLMTTADGRIFASDTYSAYLIMSLPGSTAAWLNPDAQVIVAEPRQARLVIYDLVAGTEPVATFPLKNYADVATMAVSGSQVVTGYYDGSVTMLDVISGKGHAISLHKSAVRALHFDQSGRFFMSGAMENRIKIVNGKIDAEIEESGNLFSDYVPHAPKRGLLAFATSKRTIAACGYSENIRIWHTSTRGSLLAFE
jgi:WD40 repeat protein